MDKNTELAKERVISPIYCESSGDYVLPDYKGDVRKILMSCAEVLPGGKFFNGGVIEHTGEVVYKIVYLDSEGKTCGVEFTTDYSIEAKSDEESYADSYSRLRVTNFSLRLMGPRKFSSKASLEGVMHISEKKELCIEGNTFDYSEPECLCETISAAKMVTGQVMEREYAELIQALDGVIEDDVEILLSSAEVHSLGVNIQDTEATLTGEIRMCALISEENGMPRVVEKTVSISEKVHSESFREGQEGFALVSAASVKPTLNQTDDGVNLTLAVIAEFEVVALENQEVRIIKDAFLTDRETVNGYEATSYSTELSDIVINERWSAELPLADADAENVRNICAAVAQVVSAEPKQSEKGLSIAVKIKFNCIACEVAEDGTAGCVPLRFECESLVNVNNNCQICDDCLIECHINAVSAFVETDGNKLYPSCILTGHARLVQKQTASRLSSSHAEGDVIRKDEATVVVYYPAEGETLYQVAKRYHTSPMSIAAQNSLTESVFASHDSSLLSLGVRKIIIR